MTNEKIYEKYGYKSYEKGFFDEWKIEVGKLISLNPKGDLSEMGRITYHRLKEKYKK
jgi:hypothetical protein